MITTMPGRLGRKQSFLSTLEELKKRYGDSPLTIIETGTIRNDSEVYARGDGHSTLFFGWIAKNTNGKLYTVDIDSNAMKISKRLTRPYAPWIEYVIEDSVSFLKKFQEPVHILYLDSYDSSWDNMETIKAACDHQLNEIESIYDKLDEKALVLLDDTRKDQKGGKSEFSIQFLRDRGWKELHFILDDLGNGQVLYGKQ